MLVSRLVPKVIVCRQEPNILPSSNPILVSRLVPSVMVCRQEPNINRLVPNVIVCRQEPKAIVLPSRTQY